ncbi:MAG: leucine--tRNA ligase [Mycoplasmataceae bacterium]|nr:leucine--tRNA ligase [Mycoplasmataceae bacterium]
MYNHIKIEKKWQKHWLENETFKTTDKYNKKFYVLDMFPYPSGSGLHVGHPEGYTATDIIARYKRLNGFDVLHPIGWDAFGLPAEQYAIQTGNHPNTFTNQNIGNFRTQLQSLGFSYDYKKEVNTTDPQFYKQTQWIFIQMYKKGLAEIRDVDVNWCQGLGTVLANEELITQEDGTMVSERGSFPVIKKAMKQWVLKITKYADELFDGLDEIEWPSSLKNLQKNWIRNEDGTLHLRDWIFSRQRYWGEPFPFAFDDEDNIKVINELPLLLPLMDEIKPSGTGESPLANNKEWLFFEEDGKKWRRETNTMPQWAGSSWYYLAYILKNDDGTYLDISSPEAMKRFKKWLPVDIYIGGQEHAVLHLLYARFWHKVLYDLGIVPTKEPFARVINQGMILGSDGLKMSKSKGNVVNPDDIVKKHGADTLRLYEMFMGPLEDTKPWFSDGVVGVKKWLDRVWRMYEQVGEGIINIKNSPKIDSELNILIKGVSEDIDSNKFNTAISKMMIFINSVYKEKTITKEALHIFPILLSPFAPHMAEEILFILNDSEVGTKVWPISNDKKIIINQMNIAVQVNGKLRGNVEILGTETKEELLQKAKEIENVKIYIESKFLIKEIYIPNKIINLVVK